MTAARLLVTGASGLLGADLLSELSRSYDTVAVTRNHADITDPRAISALISEQRPDWVIHAAGYSRVDECETNEQFARAVNVGGTTNTARACRDTGAGLVLFSTDYVFDGTKGAPYTESDTPNPLNVYGRTKLEAEKVVQDVLQRYIIIRTAWVYGLAGRDFIKAILRRAKRMSEECAGTTPRALKVVRDQVGNPTWSREIAQQLKLLLEKEATGLYHATSSGETSWFDYARTIINYYNMAIAVAPCTSAEYGAAAPRPAYSSLKNEQLQQAGLDLMRDYGVVLEEYLDRYGQEIYREV